MTYSQTIMCTWCRSGCWEWNWPVPSHVARVTKTVREKGDALLASAASPEQMLQYIQSSIRPFVTYGFPVGAFTYDDIRNLDSILAGEIKKAFSLPSSTPNGLVCREQQDGGMGLQSLLVDYVQITASTLTHALNDKGPLGQSTRSLMLRQLQSSAGRQVMHLAPTRDTRALASNSSHLHLLRRLCLLKDADISMQAPAWADPQLSAALYQFFAAEQHSNSLLGAFVEDWKDRLLMRYMPVLFDCGLSHLDSAVSHSQGELVMKPVSQITLVTGAPCAKRHKVVYNQLTLLLATGVERSSQATRELPQEDRIVQDITLLGELCADDLPEEEASDPAVIEAEPAKTAKTKLCRTLDDMYKGACAAVKARQRRAQEPPRKEKPKGAGSC